MVGLGFEDVIWFKVEDTVCTVEDERISSGDELVKTFVSDTVEVVFVVTIAVEVKGGGNAGALKITIICIFGIGLAIIITTMVPCVIKSVNVDPPLISRFLLLSLQGAPHVLLG